MGMPSRFFRAGALLLASAQAAATILPWPQPQPSAPPWQAAPLPPQLLQPDFQAPSAAHCRRTVAVRDTPGQPAQRADRPWPRPHTAAPFAERRGRDAAAPSAEAASAMPSGPDAAARAPMAAPAPQAQALAAPQQPPSTLTAGVVDDNADFGAYLAFRERHRVSHRPRDIRERVLLEVRTPGGRPVSDAEVLVRAPHGAALWARTDSAGRAWIHPDAFDARRAARYEVAVRQAGREAHGTLVRGQRHAVQLQLDVPRPAPRLDLVFLVDATGSMGDEIAQLRAALKTLAAEVARLPGQPDLCLGLVAYRDHGDAFLLRTHDLTHDASAFQRTLDDLQADGGGDYPEALDEALHETVHRIAWRGDGTARIVVLLADAPPHLRADGPAYDRDMLAALGKGIKVFGVGASGLDRQGEVVQRQIAQYTGGKFAFLTYAQGGDPASGPGRETRHDVQHYAVDSLERLVLRLVREEIAPLALP